MFARELLTRKPNLAVPENWQGKKPDQMAQFSLSRCRSTPTPFVALAPNPTSLWGRL